MDIGLCISRISLFGQLQIAAQENITQLELELEKVTDKNAPADEEKSIKHSMILKGLTRWKTKLGFYKDFIEFWKDQIKNFFAQIKGSSELANGAR